MVARRGRHDGPRRRGVTSLKGLINAARTGTDLIVTAPHYEWMERLEKDQMPSSAAVLHAIKAYLRLYKRPRVGRFSASAMGGCQRAIVFGYAGAPQVGVEASGEEIFDHGTVSHLKWQMEGLTMGYMTGAEVWVENKDMRVGGSIDAILSNGDVFELKSAAPSVYRRVVDEQGYPKAENIFQGDVYMLLRDAPWMSLVYEDRSYGNFHEFRIERDAAREKEVLRRLRSLNRYVDEGDLPPMLPDCEIKWGKQYKDCFFRKICPKLTSLEDAQAAGEGIEDSGVQLHPGEQHPEWVLDVIAVLEQATKEEFGG